MLSEPAEEIEAAEKVTQILSNLPFSIERCDLVSKNSIPIEIIRAKEKLISDYGNFTLSQLVAEASMTPFQMVRQFSKVYGLPPFALATVNRLHKSRILLENGHPIASIAAELGFADQSHFSRRFHAMFGVPPGVWRNG